MSYYSNIIYIIHTSLEKVITHNLNTILKIDCLTIYEYFENYYLIITLNIYIQLETNINSHDRKINFSEEGVTLSISRIKIISVSRSINVSTRIKKMFKLIKSIMYGTLKS